MIDQVMTALEPMATSLRADGYDVSVSSTPSGIEVRVIATEGACEDCLVPKDIMLMLIQDALSSGGSGAPATVDLHYPDDE